MEQLAIELGVSQRIHFLGFRRDIPTLIQAANAVILISQQEALPRSIIEAMCLATDAIARAMMRVVEAPKSMAKMAEKARIKIQDYDIEQIIEQYAEI